VARRLLPEEFLVVPPIHKHWIILVRPFLIPALIALVITVLVDVLAVGPIDGTTRAIVTLAILAGAALWAVGAWLVRLTSSLTLTNQRVIQVEGVLRRSSNVIPVDRIQDISIKQSVTGRLLSYGDIEIDTAGVVANEVFTYLPRPESLRDQLFVASRHRRRPSSGV
jgi:uncharacterized membrane protein YdbT with pleckstrin-like domain